MPVVSALRAVVRTAIACVGVIIKPTATSALSTSPNISSGAGAPSASEPNGSVYLRTDGTATTTVYQRAAGAWSALS